MEKIDGKSRKSRRGPAPLSKVEKRSYCVSVRLNASERAQINSWRGKMQRGEYLRHAAFNTLPVIVPEINRDAWVEMARVGANLNQLAKAMHLGKEPELQELTKLYAEIRMALVGIKVRK